MSHIRLSLLASLTVNWSTKNQSVIDWLGMLLVDQYLLCLQTLGL